jgi:hypothetical protein
MNEFGCSPTTKHTQDKPIRMTCDGTFVKIKEKLAINCRPPYCLIKD